MFNHYLSLVGLLKKAAKSAATCLIFEPSNTELADNVKYYHSQGVALEDSDARKVVNVAVLFVSIIILLSHSL